MNIIKIVTSDTGKIASSRCTEKYLSKLGVYEQLLISTSFMHETRTITERIIALKLKLNFDPTCPICNKRTKLHRDNGSYEFRKYCSIKCSSSDPEWRNGVSSTKKSQDHSKANEKRKETMISLYGKEFNSQRNEVKEVLAKSIADRFLSDYQKECLYSREWIDQKYNKEGFTMQKIARLLKVDLTTVQSKMKKFGFEVRRYTKDSQGQRDIASWLTELGLDVECNVIIDKNRKLEIDIYIPSLKIGIEYCGERYHSDLYRSDKFYHYNKWNMCKEAEIQLITLFESEWIYKEEKIKKFILSKLGKFPTIYARKCTFKEIDNKQANSFHLINHIQGSSPNIKRSFGLFQADTLVGCISFGYHSRNSKIQTINRLSFSDFIVIGGSSKLIKNSLNFFDNDIYTFSDNRWSTGKIYEDAGFICDGKVRVDYYYTDDNLLYNKQAMKNDDRRFEMNKIWDCGKTRWKWTNKKGR